MKSLCFLLSLVFLVLMSAAAQDRGLRTVNKVKIKELKGNTGKRYAVCIGINGYEHADIQDLRKARNDAKALGEILAKYGQFDKVFVMTDDIDPRYDKMQSYPRLRNITARLDFLKGFIRPNDLLLFSFSGHGISNSDNEGYLLPTDTDYNDVFGSSYPIRELIDWIVGLGLKKTLLLIDACREKVTESASRGFSKNNLKAARFEKAEVSAVFYATKSGWYSYEDQNSDYGVFTKYVLEGLKGKADYQYGNRDGIVTFRELSTYVEEAVTNYAMQMGLKQKPYTRINGEAYGDLAISSYSASINERTRRSTENTLVEENPNAFGWLELYSNVAGVVKIDGEDFRRIERGSTLRIEDINVGSHFIEVAHKYGVYRNEFVIREDRTSYLSNIVIANNRDIRTIRGMNFVFIKGNSSIEDFWISETEVSFGQFISFVSDINYESKNEWQKSYRENYDFYPVHNVSRDDCMAFVKWFSKKTGKKASLPTAKQWQYAAGKKNKSLYPWGNKWIKTNPNSKHSDPKGMLPIIGDRGPIQIQYFLKDITIDGVTNMAGNVREWCLDEKKNSQGNMVGTIAGGSWKLSKSKQFKSGYVTSKLTYLAAEDVGFRIVIKD